MKLKKVGSFIARMAICLTIFLAISALDFTTGWTLAATIAFCVILTYLFWKLYQWLESSTSEAK